MTQPRGRPPTGTAQSGAERARRYRQRERERATVELHQILQAVNRNKKEKEII